MLNTLQRYSPKVPIGLTALSLVVSGFQADAQSDPDLFSEVINADSPGVLPTNGFFQLTGDKQLNLFAGPSFPSLMTIGPATAGLTPTELNVFGGNLESILVIDSARANILSGSINQLGFRDATGWIDGGEFASVDVTSRSDVIVTGGRFLAPEPGEPRNFMVNFDSTARISGGTFGMDVRVQGGGALEVSGGRLNRGINALSGGSITLIGTDFGLDETPINAPTLADTDYDSLDVLSGTLADGTVFIFPNTLPTNTTFVQSLLPPADLSPITIDSGTAPELGLRPGQNLTLREGGTIGDHYRVARATLAIEGGTVGESLFTAFSKVTVTGGEIDSSNFFGGQATIRGGNFNSLGLNSGAQGIVSGGVINELLSISFGAHVKVENDVEIGSLVLNPGGSARITDGTINRVVMRGRVVGDDLVSTIDFVGGQITGEDSGIAVIDLAVFNLAGGDVDPATFWISEGGTLNITALSLSLAGNPVSLDPGQTLRIDLRDGSLLEAVLADGSNFSFVLNETPNGINPFGRDGISPGGVLNVTVVPEPSGSALLLAIVALTLPRRRLLTAQPTRRDDPRDARPRRHGNDRDIPQRPAPDAAVRTGARQLPSH